MVLYVQADGSLSTTVPRASWGYNPVDWVLAVFWMAVHCFRLPPYLSVWNR